MRRHASAASSRDTGQLTRMSHVRRSPRWTISGGSTPRKSQQTPGPVDYADVDIVSFKVRREPSCTFGTGPGHSDVSFVDTISTATPSPRSTSLTSLTPASSRRHSARPSKDLRDTGSAVSPSNRSNTSFSFGTAARGLDPRSKDITNDDRRCPLTPRGRNVSPRSERFGSPGPGAYNPEPVKPEMPKVSIGKAPRHVVVELHDHPGPAEYNGSRTPSTDLPSWRFGTEPRGLVSKPSRNSQLGPGPGSYNLSQRIGNDSPAHTIGRKYKIEKHASPDIQFLPQYSQFVH